MRLPIIFLLAVGLAGCGTVEVQAPAATAEPAPLPEPEPAVVPTAWRHANAADPALAGAWWKSLNDETLNALVDQAMLANPEIRVAETRLSEIERIAAEAEPDEQAAAKDELQAATNDNTVVHQAVIHALVTAYLDARLAEQRHELLNARQRLERELTSTLHKRLSAGISDVGTLREQEQSDIETHQAIAHARHDQEQAVLRLALLLGVPPVEFALPAGGNPVAADQKLGIDTPGTIMERRPDVQAAWQHLLAANASATADDDDDASSAAQMTQVDALPATRDALYRKTVLTALQDVELATLSWRRTRAELKASQEMLEILSSRVANTQRAMEAGRLSRVEALKARIAENVARENVLLASHARSIAFAAVQLAVAHE